MISVRPKVLEDALEALSSARDFLTALDTAASARELDEVVKLSPLTLLVEEQTERIEILLRPEFPGSP